MLTEVTNAYQNEILIFYFLISENEIKLFHFEL